jgi:hypothetical protein
MSMDARLYRFAALVPALALLGASAAHGATFSTANFVVTTGDAEFARQCAQTAEKYRKELAREWLGHDLPRWFRPCQVSVTVGQIGAGGATTFTFAAGQVFGWTMKVQGTPERVLDSVIPHEVSHTIFASFFRRPLPRWADEGAASLVEHESERHRQTLLLHQVFNTPQRIPLTNLISMKEYPSDMQAVLTLYAEGYSLADYLVQSGGETGKERFLRFLQDAHEHDWNYAIHTWYGLRDVTSLERRWNNWVMAGSPEIRDIDNRAIAQADAQEMRKKGILVRSQSPDDSPRSVRRPQLQAAESAAQQVSLPRSDEPAAPDPIPRASRPATQTAENSGMVEPPTDEALGNELVAARRREGRDRLLQDGWQQLPAGEKAVQTHNDGRQQTVSAESDANESPVRKRFRDAKQHRDEQSLSGLKENEDPFENSHNTTASSSNVEQNESPFHTVN